MDKSIHFISWYGESQPKIPMAFPMNISTNSWNLKFPNIQTPGICVKPLNCIPIQQQGESVIMCESCNGKGWLLCEFCKGQKTNVKAENKRVYRRCPSCKAIGSVLCSKCKVYRCVTFPDREDGDILNF